MILGSRIDGIDSVASEVVKATIVQATIEIMNAEPRNDKIVASVIVTDGTTCLRVTGLKKVVGQQLEHSRWSLTPEQADCVRQVRCDSTAKIVNVILTDAGKAVAVARSSADADCDGGAKCSDSESDSADESAQPLTARPREICFPPQMWQQQQHRPKKEHKERKPFFSVPVDTYENAAPPPTPVPPPPLQQPVVATAIPAPPPPIVQTQPTAASAVIESRKTRLPLVARAVARMADAAAIRSERLVVRAEMFGSNRPRHRYCSVVIGGITLFDWRLLNPGAAWTSVVRSRARSLFQAEYDLENAELVVRISPPDQVDFIYEELTTAPDDDDNNPSRKRKRGEDDDLGPDHKRPRADEK